MSPKRQLHKTYAFAFTVVSLIFFGYQIEYRYIDGIISNASSILDSNYFDQPSTIGLTNTTKKFEDATAPSYMMDKTDTIAKKESLTTTIATSVTPAATTTSTDKVNIKDGTIIEKKYSGNGLRTKYHQNGNNGGSSSSTVLTTMKSPTANTATTNPTNNPNLPSIIVQLRGELGNHLSVWSHAKGLQLMLQENYNISTNLIIRHQMLDNDRTDNPKWKPTELKIKQCFPNLRGYDHSGGNGNQYKVSKRIQDLWLYKTKDDNSKTTSSLTQLGNDLIRVNGIRLPLYEYVTQEEITKGLDAFAKLLDISKNTTISSTSLAASSSTKSATPFTTPSISIPHLVVFTLANNFIVDKYYEQIREYFAFDYDACCKERPYPDETVFHYRNFKKEMSLGHANSLGFAELKPNRTAYELLGHLKRGDKVAITTRFHSPDVQQYVDAMTSRGLQVRVITGQKDVEDFCFLLSAQRELVGNVVSTYVKWAAFLGNATNVKLLVLDSSGLRKVTAGVNNGTGVDSELELIDKLGFRWTNPTLQRRVQFVEMMKS